MPNGVKPTALRRAGKVDDAVPDADVPTGRMSAKLNDMPGPKRQRTTEQFDQLDSDGSDYLGNTDVDDASLKAADLFENTGPKGRRALNDLADGDREAADVLLEMDPNTQWRFVRAYDQGDASADELATALRRYDELDASERPAANTMVARGGDDAVSLVGETVCYNPCTGFTDAWHALKGLVGDIDATTFRNRLLDAKRRGEISEERAADILGDATTLANDRGVDVTDVINRDDVFSRAVIRRYAESDSVDASLLRRMHRLGEIDLADDQIKRKYKHADDFGVSGTNNPANRDRFKEAIAGHTTDPNTRVIDGEYRGTSVTHLYNPNTGNNVIVEDGEFLTGFRLNSAQRRNIESDGSIGGS